jgi:preprotein translocase subunit YajC
VGTKFLTGGGQWATVLRIKGNEVFGSTQDDGHWVRNFWLTISEVEAALALNPSPQTDHRDSSSRAKTSGRAEASRIGVGTEFTTGTGQHAIVRGVTGNDVWVDITENGRFLGTFRFATTAVEAQMAQQDVKVPGPAAGSPPHSQGFVASPNTPPPNGPGVAERKRESPRMMDRLSEFWRKLSIWGRFLVVGAVGLILLLLLNVSGALESPKMRECMNFSANEYELARGEKPDAAEKAIQKRVCENLIKNGLWR